MNGSVKRRKLVIFGSAEIASLARYYFEQDSAYEVVGFTVDDDFAKTDSFDGLPLVPFSRVTERFPAADHDMNVALSYRRLNQLRKEKCEQARKAGYVLASYVCSKSVTWPDLSVGDNCFILENQTIQPTVKIGNGVMIWSGNHLGHGAQIGDHTYIASHVVISGHVQIGPCCFLGVNATVRDFVKIGEGCFIAMDASVVQDVPEGAVVVGQSGTIIPADDRRARVLKAKYFG
jgi:sugar O-acyltransferase (sialic acid O-acetyltransferase NeuD family)